MAAPVSPVSSLKKDSTSAPSGHPARLAFIDSQPRNRSAKLAVPVRLLTDVGAQGGHFFVERRGHVDEGVAAGRSHHPDLSDHVRLEPGLRQLGKGEGIAGVGVHGTESGLPDGQMIGMAGEHALPPALRARAQHPIRPDLADDPSQIAAQFQGGLDADRRGSRGRSDR